MKKLMLAIYVMVFGLFLQAQEFKSLDFVNNGGITNGIKIKTNIPYSDGSQMSTIILEGYNYGKAESIGVIINWYVYQGSFYKYTASSYGSYTPEIKLAKENSKVVIYINDQTYYMRFQIRSYAKGLPHDIEANYIGWTWADEALTGSNVVTVPYKAINNDGWLNSGDEIVYNDKNVGIGTSTPDYKLEVNGTLGVKGHFTSLRSSSNTFLRLDDNGYTGYGSASSLSDGANILLYGKSSSRADNLALRNSTGEKMTIIPNGNIGIGIEAPVDKLQVNGGSISIGPDGGAVMPNLSREPYEGGLAITRVNTTDGSLNRNLMMIKGGGNVGIGTTTPDEKLAVNGKIHTKEVKVDLTGWSDFVFYEDYKLPTLEEVENHINSMGHLKDIPSAKEVEDDGILLGEMNAKLLQKIEELTLYTIAQQKEIEDLKLELEKVDNLKEENKELKGLTKRLEKLEAILKQ